jgi:hypothetical protein
VAAVPGLNIKISGRPNGCGQHHKKQETPLAFFRRVELSRVKALLADLESLTPQEAVPADFIDLGEETQFKVETQEGECVA